jgi:hypothetical protein
VNVVDVNVIIISKATKEQVFKDKEPSICTNEWLIFGQKNIPHKIHVIVLNGIFILVTLVKL